jgi:hypothetical protein
MFCRVKSFHRTPSKVGLKIPALSQLSQRYLGTRGGPREITKDTSWRTRTQAEVDEADPKCKINAMGPCRRRIEKNNPIEGNRWFSRNPQLEADRANAPFFDSMGTLSI